MDELWRVLGGAVLCYLGSWVVRFAVRAELNRAMRPRKPSVITEEIDAENRAVYTYPCPNCGNTDHK